MAVGLGSAVLLKEALDDTVDQLGMRHWPHVTELIELDDFELWQRCRQ